MIPIGLNIFFLITYHFQVYAGLRGKRKGDLWIQVDERDIFNVRICVNVRELRPSRFIKGRRNLSPHQEREK